jgi:hypothetical protein
MIRYTKELLIHLLLPISPIPGAGYRKGRSAQQRKFTSIKAEPWDSAVIQTR